MSWVSVWKEARTLGFSLAVYEARRALSDATLACTASLYVALSS